MTGTCGSASLSWNTEGNLSSDGTRTYTYDGEGDGHILSVTTSAGTVGTYTYDPFGQRFSKTTSSGTTYYVHDDRGNEVAEYSLSGSSWVLARKPGYSPQHLAPVYMRTASGTVTFNYVDRLGSVVLITDAAGVPVNQYAYLPYGDSNPPNISAGTTVPSGGATAGTSFGYDGYRYDPESGLYHTGARYYDPRLGRFLQPDPSGQQGGLNIYAYVQNDPLNLNDPTGLLAGEIASGAWNLTSQGATIVAQGAKAVGQTIVNSSAAGLLADAAVTQGNHMVQAAGYLAVGGTGLVVAGAISAQPEIMAVGQVGNDVAAVVGVSGRGLQTVGAFIQSLRQNSYRPMGLAVGRAILDPIQPPGAGVGPALDPTDPLINGTMDYFGVR